MQHAGLHIAAQRKQAQREACDQSAHDQLRFAGDARDLRRDKGPEPERKHEYDVDERQRLRAAFEIVRNKRRGVDIERHEHKVHHGADEQQHDEHARGMDERQPFQKTLCGRLEVRLFFRQRLLETDKADDQCGEEKRSRVYHQRAFAAKQRYHAAREREADQLGDPACGLVERGANLKQLRLE